MMCYDYNPYVDSGISSTSDNNRSVHHINTASPDLSADNIKKTKKKKKKEKETGVPNLFSTPGRLPTQVTHYSFPMLVPSQTHAVLVATPNLT